MDWALFHLLNGSLRGHPLLQDELADFVQAWAVPLFATATIGLWLVDRPGRAPRWRLACLSALAAAALGLLLSQPIGWLWPRDRPFVAHPRETLLLVSPSHEPSFPSDHAVVAFAIAVAVVLVSRRVGAVFLAGAAAVALSRVLVGLHYPGDVAGGALIGAAAAPVAVLLARLAVLAGRATDPLVRPAWRALDAARAWRRRTP